MILTLSVSTALIPAQAAQRWYSDQQEKQGARVFQQNCATCHGQNAEATPNWKQTDANGIYPPPPLNGTAHAWHHDLDLLRKTIREGGLKLGGVMPPFEGKLSSEQIDQAIAYFQSKWPEQLYQKWAGRFIKAELPSLTEEEASPDQPITRLLKERLGNIAVEQTRKTAIEDVWQVKLQNRYLYLLDQGRYAVIGDLINLQDGQNLTELDRRISAVDAITGYKDTELVVYSPAGEVKATLNIFTDTSCPYCRKLHQEVPRLLQAGIQVRYLPYARGGQGGPGYQTLKSVWCSSDRAQAMTDAKNEKIEGLPAGNCNLAVVVDKAYITGNQVGVTGTPSIFKSNGEKIEGYVPYQQLIPLVLK